MTDETSDKQPQQALIVAANRGPVTFQTADDGSRTFTRGTGGLVTALIGLAGRMPITWIACARSEDDLDWGQGHVAVDAGPSQPPCTSTSCRPTQLPTMVTTTLLPIRCSGSCSTACGTCRWRR